MANDLLPIEKTGILLFCRYEVFHKDSICGILYIITNNYAERCESMKLPEDDFYDDDKRSGSTAIKMTLGVSFFILLILGGVLYANKEQMTSKKTAQQAKVQQEQQEAEENPYIRDTTLTSDELEFWDTYKEVKEAEEALLQEQKEQKEQEEKEKAEQEAEEQEPETPEPEPDLTQGGRRTLIQKADGTEEWVLVNPDMNKHTYDFSKLVYEEPLMKYVEDSKTTSFVGVDISKYNGNIDFRKLKNAGIDYAMIRVGSRAYGSGQITLDDKFEDNINAALTAGLGVGVYFFSQAVTEAEAVEEANFVLEHIKDKKITYPIVFDMEEIENDIARIDGVSVEDKTKIATAFLAHIKAAGHKPMIYGDKEWLLQKIDLTKLKDYDIWLSQVAEKPEYPYRFTMWQYTHDGEIDGVSGAVDLNISFVNYEMK